MHSMINVYKTLGMLILPPALNITYYFPLSLKNAFNVRCVCVSPGPVLTRPAMANMKTLVGRAADPQEIVDLIFYIASDKGAFINGTNILIDGGRNAMGRRY